MAFNKTLVYNSLMKALSYTNTSKGNISELKKYESSIYKSDLEDAYSEPMLVIGVYIAVASLCCILLMVADFIHGLGSHKLWFPCKYFSVNAFSLSVIAVAMKLPVDLSGNMPGDVDQAAKLASLAFLCVMMANLLPCLATMSSTELLTNITALGVLVVTLVVNVCIQIKTGVVGTIPNGESLETLSATGESPDELKVIGDIIYGVVAGIYVALLLMLLIIYVCSSLAILSSKEIIETKYQNAHKLAASKPAGELLIAEQLEQHVSNYWIMAGSGNPQFIQACSATTTASGVICALTLVFHTLVMIWAIPEIEPRNYNSDYKWSTLVILIVQSVGVILGSFAPLFRCCASLNFKLSWKITLNHIKFFKVEKYWTQKLHDWKHGSISLPFRSHTLKVVINNLKRLILSICIILQVVVVVECKIIALILFLNTIYLRFLRWLLQVMLDLCGNKSEPDLKQRKFVLHLENENELGDTTLKHLLKSFDRLIKKSEKKQPENLMKLITERSTKGFPGVRKYDNNNHPDCWSLAVVTLTTIAATLPNIEKAEVKRLLKSVREGLEYVTLVEETLNATDDYESIQKAAKTLWEEVDFRHKWLGIRLKDIASQGNTSPHIVQLFWEKAEEKKAGKKKAGKKKAEEKQAEEKQAEEKKAENIEGPDEKAEKTTAKNIEIPDGTRECTFICANSMSHIAKIIIDDKEIDDQKLFDELSSRIADIMAACLTNLPGAIVMKCHTSVIEKREASVQAAAQFLGETKEIIKTLHEGDLKDKWHAYSRMGRDDLPFIDKWRAHLSEP